jgi:2,3-bisphosphoglycerate-dependent phosphoglycerate mutase
MSFNKKIRLILIRHGESLWNHLNIYTGWSNPGLTDKGRHECSFAGELIRDRDIHFTKGYSSVLDRARETYHLIYEQLEKSEGSVIKLCAVE